MRGFYCAASKYFRYLCDIVVAREPVHELFTVLFERPQVAVLEKHHMRRLKFFQERGGCARKSLGHILVVGSQEIRKRYLQLAFA